MKTDVTTSTNDGDGNQQWVKWQGGWVLCVQFIPLAAICRTNWTVRMRFLQQLLKNRHHVLHLQARKQQNIFSPFISLNFGLEHPKIKKKKVPKWMIDTSWRGVLLVQVFFFHSNKCGDAVDLERFLHLFVKVPVWSSAVHGASF